MILQVEKKRLPPSAHLHVLYVIIMSHKQAVFIGFTREAYALDIFNIMSKQYCFFFLDSYQRLYRSRLQNQ